MYYVLNMLNERIQDSESSSCIVKINYKFLMETLAENQNIINSTCGAGHCPGIELTQQN